MFLEMVSFIQTFMLVKNYLKPKEKYFSTISIPFKMHILKSKGNIQFYNLNIDHAADQIQEELAHKSYEKNLDNTMDDCPNYINTSTAVAPQPTLVSLEQIYWLLNKFIQ